MTELKPAAWVEKTKDGHTRMWHGDLSAWANRPAIPDALFDQATIDALLLEISTLKWRANESSKEASTLREAMLRAKQWCGMGKSYDSGVALELMRWVEAGMYGPLPPLPEYLEGANKNSSTPVSHNSGPDT